MPVAARFAINSLIHVATDLFLNRSTNWWPAISGQDVGGFEPWWSGHRQ
jgi:hypothetical protein